jgi:hypothetical protein
MPSWAASQMRLLRYFVATNHGSARNARTASSDTKSMSGPRASVRA